MKTRNIENGLALLGALLILVAVAFAATTVFNSPLQLEFPAQTHISTSVAYSS